jgi:hypothetical protein
MYAGLARLSEAALSCRNREGFADMYLLMSLFVLDLGHMKHARRGGHANYAN